MLWWLLLPPIALYRFYKDWRSPLGRHSFKARFALGEIPKADILIHAVSLGEVRAVTPFVHRLLETYPDKKILFTATTLTGSRQIKESFGDRVLHTFLPLDGGAMTRRFLKKVAPRVILIMETEIWPNLFHQAKILNIPLFIISACLSDRSFYRYQKIPKTIGSLLSQTYVLAQTDDDVARFKALGVKFAQKMGNIKYEMRVPDKAMEAVKTLTSIKGSALFWIVASTHEGEEAGILTAFCQLKAQFPELKLLLAPRHPERFKEVENLIKNADLRYLKRSETALNEFHTDTDLWLIDTIGELLTFYAISDITTVAGSFVPIGGHNILEPAYFGKPIIVGPFMHENSEIFELFKANNAIVSCDYPELANVIKELIEHPEKREILGQNAHRTMMENQGASDTILHAIEPFID